METHMKPILFSSSMVRAILSGKKCLTRRVIKPQPHSIRNSPFVPSGIEDIHGREIKAPYRPGDVLWVRETWAFFYSLYRGMNFIAYRADLKAYQKSARWGEEIIDLHVLEKDPYAKPIKWRSPVTMPQWASRRHVRILSCVPEQRDEWGWKIEWEEVKK